METQTLIDLVTPPLKMWVAEMLAKVAEHSKSYPHELTLPITFDGRYFEITLVIPAYIESGRRAGKQPPVEPIKIWAKEKNIIPRAGETLEQMAFAIARHIGRVGTKPKMFLTDAFATTPMPDIRAQIDEYFLSNFPEFTKP